jgi:glycosyltransferase involved in cell wall biosynthesis
MKISCLIPVYNSQRYLAATLDSVLAQDWPLHEVIAIDDGSTDGSAGILGRYAASVRTVEQAHAGVAAARNRGLREAAGDVIAFQDSDDLWPAGRLRLMAEALEQDPPVDAVAGRIEIMDERAVKPPLRENLETIHRVFCMPSLLIRRRVFDVVGFFNEDLETSEDTEFAMRARTCGISFKLIDAISLRYRLHADNISRSVERTHHNTLAALRAVSAMRKT